MKVIVFVLIIIGFLVMINMNGSNSVINDINSEKQINNNLELINIAKDSVSIQNNSIANQISTVNMLNNTSEINKVRSQNIGSLMKIAEETKK